MHVHTYIPTNAGSCRSVLSFFKNVSAKSIQPAIVIPDMFGVSRMGTSIRNIVHLAYLYSASTIPLTARALRSGFGHCSAYMIPPNTPQANRCHSAFKGLRGDSRPRLPKALIGRGMGKTYNIRRASIRDRDFPRFSRIVHHPGFTSVSL